jgi:hypothetical protein
MSNIYTPKSDKLKSSPALPHLQACIEAAVRDAVQSGRPEDAVRQSLRDQAEHFDEILHALHNAYDLHPAQQYPEASATNGPSDNPQPNLLPAAEIVEHQPAIRNDVFDPDRVEDDPDELVQDEDAKAPAVQAPPTRRVTHRPSALPPSPEKQRITDGAKTVRRAEERGFKPVETPAAGNGNGDGSHAPGQKSVVGSPPPPPPPPPPGQQTFLLGRQAFAVDVDRLSVVAVDPEQARSDQRNERVRDWDAGQSLCESPLADPKLPAAGDPRVAEPGSEDPESLLASLRENGYLSSPHTDRLALVANDPVELERLIRRAAEARAREQMGGQQSVGGPGQGALTGSQTEMGREEHGVFAARIRAEESEMADPTTSADNDASSLGNANETGGDPQHSNANDAEPGSTDDKSPKLIK